MITGLPDPRGRAKRSSLPFLLLHEKQQQQQNITHLFDIQEIQYN